MSFYRDIYLKSEDWKNLRAAIISSRRGECFLCRKRSDSNDVHHLCYRNLWDVYPSDLMILCRVCHDDVHALMEKYPLLSKIRPLKLLRKTIKMHLRTKRHRIKTAERHATPEYAASKRKNDVFRVERAFYKAKSELFKLGLIYRNRMRFVIDIVDDARARASIGNPVELLKEYIRVTKRDPRTMRLDIIRRFPKP